MSRFLSFPDPSQPRRLAILLVNLGTPDAPDTASVRRYLAEFLADPRIVEQPRWLWWLILNGIILRFRPARSARAYTKVWTAQGSPLQVQTTALAERLQAALEPALGTEVLVRHAMRYGSPSLPETLAELAGLGMRRLLVVPLFPQFSATTTASVFDAVSAQFVRWRCPPARKAWPTGLPTRRWRAASNSIGRPAAEVIGCCFRSTEFPSAMCAMAIPIASNARQRPANSGNVSA